MPRCRPTTRGNEPFHGEPLSRNQRLGLRVGVPEEARKRTEKRGTEKWDDGERPVSFASLAPIFLSLVFLSSLPASAGRTERGSWIRQAHDLLAWFRWSPLSTVGALTGRLSWCPASAGRQSTSSSGSFPAASGLRWPASPDRFRGDFPALPASNPSAAIPPPQSAPPCFRRSAGKGGRENFSILFVLKWA